MSALRSFHFGIVFWGESFRSVFTDLCLLSLLSNGNIPSLENGGGNRFLICTTRADWDALQEDATFRLMRDYIEPELVEMAPPEASADKMVVMSEGHRMIAGIMFERRVYGVFIYPDTVFSDGTVATLQGHARAGKKAVLASCPRLANEGFLAELEAGGRMRPGHPPSLSSRDLVAMALRHIHSETRRYEWDRPYFAELPVCPYWRVPGNDESVVMHSFIWAPVMLDYGAVREHVTGTLDEWTIDGDYVERNFGDHADDVVHVVTDSDEMMLVSFTPEADLHIPMTRNWVKRLPGVGTLLKLALLHDLYHGPAIDPLKRRIFDRTVHYHGGALTPRSEATARRAALRIGLATRRRGGIAGALAIAAGKMIAEMAEPSRRVYYRQRLAAFAGSVRAYSKLPFHYWRAYCVPRLWRLPKQKLAWAVKTARSYLTADYLIHVLYRLYVPLWVVPKQKLTWVVKTARSYLRIDYVSSVLHDLCRQVVTRRQQIKWIHENRGFVFHRVMQKLARAGRRVNVDAG